MMRHLLHTVPFVRNSSATMRPASDGKAGIAHTAPGEAKEFSLKLMQMIGDRELQKGAKPADEAMGSGAGAMDNGAEAMGSGAGAMDNGAEAVDWEISGEAEAQQEKGQENGMDYAGGAQDDSEKSPPVSMERTGWEGPVSMEMTGRGESVAEGRTVFSDERLRGGIPAGEKEPGSGSGENSMKRAAEAIVRLEAAAVSPGQENWDPATKDTGSKTSATETSGTKDAARKASGTQAAAAAASPEGSDEVSGTLPAGNKKGSSVPDENLAVADGGEIRESLARAAKLPPEKILPVEATPQEESDSAMRQNVAPDRSALEAGGLAGSSGNIFAATPSGIIPKEGRSVGEGVVEQAADKAEGEVIPQREPIGPNQSGSLSSEAEPVTLADQPAGKLSQIEASFEWTDPEVLENQFSDNAVAHEGPEVAMGEEMELSSVNRQSALVQASGRRELAVRIHQLIHREFTQPGAESQGWKNHRLILEDGTHIRFSVRQIEKVLQMQLGSQHYDLNRLIQNHASEIRQHLQEQMNLEVDLHFGDRTRQGNSDGPFAGGRVKHPGRMEAPSGGEAPEGRNRTAEVRRFGFNRIEWVA